MRLFAFTRQKHDLTAARCEISADDFHCTRFAHSLTTPLEHGGSVGISPATQVIYSGLAFGCQPRFSGCFVAQLLNNIVVSIKLAGNSVLFGLSLKCGLLVGRFLRRRSAILTLLVNKPDNEDYGGHYAKIEHISLSEQQRPQEQALMRGKWRSEL